jgi:hypothetical protein
MAALVACLWQYHPMPRRFIRWIPVTVALLVLFALAGGAWIVRVFDPEKFSVLPPCRFHQMTGLQCPGCGMTRATHHLLNGRIAPAFYFNAFFVSVLPVLGVWGAWLLQHWYRGRPLAGSAVVFSAWLGGALGVVWIVFWVVRNQPAWPLL